MTITFFSNFFNHHQKPLCDAFDVQVHVKFTFVATIEMPLSFKKAGYNVPKTSYELRAHESTENWNRALQLIENSDIIIYGAVNDALFKQRVKANKLTFKYSERVFRKPWHIYDPRRILHLVRYHTVNYRKNYFLLCTGGYVANDFRKVMAFPNKKIKWGYFTAVKPLDLQSILENKAKDIFKILFVGRLIPLKNPEILIALGTELRKQNIKFEIEFVGVGPLEGKLKENVKQLRLQEYYTFTANVPNQTVLEKMREAHVLIFSSNKEEGWGAVCNEALANGCALVTTNEIGAAPFLIQPNKNGMIYKYGNLDELINIITQLQGDPELLNKIIHNGYKTINETWSPLNAVKNLLLFSKQLESEKKNILEGPCSQTEYINYNWYL